FDSFFSSRRRHTIISRDWSSDVCSSDLTEGIQPNIVHEIGEIILKLNREANLTVLLVEQKLPFARRVASEFRMIDKGRIVAGGEIGGLTDELVKQHLTV